MKNHTSKTTENTAKEVTISSSNELIEIAEVDLEKTIYNALELMAMGDIEQKYLMEPIFPQKGSAVLAGKPDTGKSQFARQLCIQVALGIKEFVGFELNPVHSKSIYIATEDNIDATQFLLNKQVTGLGEKATENIRFMFADTMEQEEILKQLDKALTDDPADLVVVDSFGDIFKGHDSNNNMVMRNTVKLFDKIAKKHKCLILFVHHINKGAYRIAPGQENIQGGSGLTQKVRLAVILSEGVGNIRYFTVVKGNYCPKKYKQYSLELIFSEENFLFSNTGNLILTSDIGTQPGNLREKAKKNELTVAAQSIISDEPITYSNFVKQFCEMTDKSEPTAKRAIKSLIDSGVIEKYQGNYRLKEAVSEESADIESED